jgi:hypothetical protein
MRRPIVVAALLVTLAGIPACSGSSSPGVPEGRSGAPTATTSPTGASPTPTSTPPPVTDPADASAAASASASSASAAALDLPGCLLGSWTAPVDREFGNLGLQQRTGGAVRGATGDVSLRFAPDGTFGFGYDAVKLQVTAGTVDVTGTIDGTWSLAGDTLSTTVRSSAVKAAVDVGGVRFDAPEPVTAGLRSLPPNQVRVSCTGGGLQFQLPTAQGGGTATFDRA